jgi:curved DNA-binding protein CbpA
MGLEDLRLTPQETRAAGLFDGSRSPAEIAAAAPAEAIVVLRLAVLLGEVELLAFGASRKGAPPAHPTPAEAKAAIPPAAPQPAPAPTSAAPQPAPAPTSATPSKPAAGSAPPVRPGAPPKAGPGPSARSAAPPAKPAAAPPAPKAAAPPPLDDAALRALYARLKDADHFTVLGVKQDAPASQIKIAYFQLAKAYHPDAVPATASAETLSLCGDVFAKVSEAWAVLGEDAPRAAYLEKLRSGGTAEVDVMAILQAENVFQDGTLLVKARRYDEALRKFEEAMKLNPDEAEFGMWKAWCEFVLADDKRRKLGACSSIVEEGLKKNPRCAQGYLFLGQMAKLAGDLALAEKQLRRGLHVAPEHAEMQRELKYLRK